MKPSVAAWPTSSTVICDLLTRVADEHEREVSTLRSENRRLAQGSSASDTGKPGFQLGRCISNCQMLVEETSERSLHDAIDSREVLAIPDEYGTVGDYGDYGATPRSAAHVGARLDCAGPEPPDEDALRAAFDAANDRTTDASDEFLDTDIREDWSSKAWCSIEDPADGVPWMPSSTSKPKFGNGIRKPIPEANGVDQGSSFAKRLDKARASAEGDGHVLRPVKEVHGDEEVQRGESPYSNGIVSEDISVRFSHDAVAAPALNGWQKLLRYAQAKTDSPDLVFYEIDDMWTKAAVEFEGPSRKTFVRNNEGFADNRVSHIPSIPLGVHRLSLRGSKKRSAVRNPIQMPSRCDCIKSLITKPKCGIMHPNSRQRIIWDLIGMTLLTHDLIMIPMQVFQTGTTGLPTDYDPDFTTVLDVVSACFWSGDMLVSFMTGYYSTEGFLIVSPAKVARKYMASWFWLDISIVLADWATIVVGFGLRNTGYLRLGKAASRVLRVLRLLRFMKLSNFVQEIIERINSEYLLTLAGLVKLVVIIIVINHYIACMWYALSQAGYERNWAEEFLYFPGQTAVPSMAMAYSTSLHWSLTQFTPASMEVVPQNATERVFNTLVIIMAMVTFSSFVSSITSAMTHIRSINAQKMQQDSKIRQYFCENNVSHQVASRVWRFLKKNKNAARVVKEEDIPVLKTLPERIRDELRLEVYMPILAAHPVFHIYFSMDARPLLLIIKQCLEPLTLLSSQEIFPDSTRITKMFFVSHGRAFYHPSQTDHSDYLIVGCGMWACEAALWSARAQLEGPFVAASGGVSLIMLSTDKFQAVAKQYPDSVKFLAFYARLFVESLNEATGDPDYSYLLFDNVETVQELALTAYDQCGITIEKEQKRLGKDDLMEKLFDSIDRTRSISKAVTMQLDADEDAAESPPSAHSAHSPSAHKAPRERSASDDSKGSPNSSSFRPRSPTTSLG